MTEPTATTYPGPGEILDGKYRVEKLLGEGGMGAVARATHLLLHRTVAVKFMNPQFMSFPGAVERFLNEGRASGVIKSDHVVPVSDVGCLSTGTPYLVMECLYGLDLADLLARDGPSGLPVQRAVHFVLQILRGLQAAHAIGIIHRDMKPSNCFVVTEDGEEDFIKILDFGISKIAQPGSASLTQTNSALGTPLYMSPEQARSPRDVDARSDLYSVGVILYELLSGRTPFFSESGEFTEILFQLFTSDPPPIRQSRPDLPEELATVVHRALAREVPERYATALEFAEALVPFASPKSLVLVERMRGYKPPAKESVAPIDGLPTSMVAFSQLQRGHGTDVMANRPTTDVQKGVPVTEILMPGPPGAPQKTEILAAKAKGQPDGRMSAVPELFSMRASPADALGRTQLDPDPGGSARPPKAAAAAQTDLNAARDTAQDQTATAARRSPLIYALPVVAVLGLVVGVVLVIGQSGGPSRDKGGATTNGSAEPTPSAVVSLAPPTASASPSASSVATAASASSAPVVAESAAPAASASAPKPKTAPNKPGPTRPYDPGLDGVIHN
jgi:serine/threonine-protein kinase